MKIALASDHTAVSVRKKVRDMLNNLGARFVDFGCLGEGPVDYPDMAYPVARAVSRGDCDQGILICGTGIGISIAANKVRGVRAALCHDEFTTEMARKHNHANVLCLGSKVLDDDQIMALVQIWLNTDPEDGRHDRRVEKVTEIEQKDP